MRTRFQWLPIGGFLLGIALTLSAVVGIRAFGQDRGDSLGKLTVEADEGGIEALYNGLFRNGAPDPPDAPDDLPPAEELAKERYELAGEQIASEVKQELARFLEPPKNGDGRLVLRLGVIVEWSRYRMQARRDMGGPEAEVIEAMRRELAYTEAVLETLNTLSKRTVSITSRSDLRALELYRLELQYQLAVMKGN